MSYSANTLEVAFSFFCQNAAVCAPLHSADIGLSGLRGLYSDNLFGYRMSMMNKQGK